MQCKRFSRCQGNAPLSTRECFNCDTRKEVDKYFDEVFIKIRKAKEAIINATGGRKGVSGRIDCPACESGKLAYAVHHNGHIHAACESPGCVKWSE